MPLPQEIIGIMNQDVSLIWEDEHRTTYSARDLRLRCRCARCVEETSGKPLLDPAKVPQDVMARNIEMVGQYAINIKWTDGHETGIYNFRDLRRNCPCAECRAAAPRK